MRSIKFYLILLFAICTFAVNAQTPQGYPANYANGPRFKALVFSLVGALFGNDDQQAVGVMVLDFAYSRHPETIT